MRTSAEGVSRFFVHYVRQYTNNRIYYNISDAQHTITNYRNYIHNYKCYVAQKLASLETELLMESIKIKTSCYSNLVY